MPQEQFLSLPSLTLQPGDLAQLCEILTIDGENWEILVEASTDDRKVITACLGELRESPVLPNRLCDVEMDLKGPNGTTACFHLRHNAAKARLRSDDTTWLNASALGIQMFAAARRSRYDWLFSRILRIAAILIPFFIVAGSSLTIMLLRLASSELETLVPSRMIGYPWGIFGSILLSLLVLSQFVARFPKSWFPYTEIYLRTRAEPSFAWNILAKVLAGLIVTGITCRACKSLESPVACVSSALVKAGNSV